MAANPEFLLELVLKFAQFLCCHVTVVTKIKIQG